MTSISPPETAARQDPWRRARPLLAVAFWLAVWQGVALAVRSPVLLVGPWQVAVRLTQLVPTLDFWAAVGRTSGRITLGFVLAALVGVLLATLSAASRWAEALIAPLVVTIRSTPVVAVIILLLVWADVAWLATIVSFLMTLPIVHTTVLSGIGQRDRALLEMAAVFRLPRWRRLMAIDVPGVLPSFVTACRTGVGYAWKSGVAAEVIGLPSGTIGERMYQGRLFLETADVLAWTVVVVLVAFACEKLLLAGLRGVERRLSDLPRSRTERGEAFS
jgi:NitT/TauT family transport system permease protein